MHYETHSGMAAHPSGTVAMRRCQMWAKERVSQVFISMKSTTVQSVMVRDVRVGFVGKIGTIGMPRLTLIIVDTVRSYRGHHWPILRPEPDRCG